MIIFLGGFEITVILLIFLVIIAGTVETIINMISFLIAILCKYNSSSQTEELLFFYSQNCKGKTEVDKISVFLVV